MASDLAPPPNCTIDNLEAAAPAGSLPLLEYLRRTYGWTGARRYQTLQRWQWDRVDLVWLSHLPSALHSCVWPRNPTEHGSFFVPPPAEDRVIPAGSLWRYGHDGLCRRANMPGVTPEARRVECGDPEKGGPLDARRGTRAPVLVLDGRDLWIEVSHSYVPGYLPYESAALWMYKASGSGAWYRLGRTLVCTDTLDLARWLNLTLVDVTRWVRDKSPPNRNAPVSHKGGVLLGARAMGFESLVFTHHIDPGHLNPRTPGRGYFKTEVVGLRRSHNTSYESCPPDPTMRCGCHAERRDCRCRGGEEQRNGTFAPYQHVRLLPASDALASANTSDACAPAPFVRLNVSFHAVRCAARAPGRRRR
eukprot:1281216-Prymnesium_polylepis.2